MIAAWGDESGSVHRIDPGTYILGAALSFEENVEAARQVMESIRLPSEKKVHWRSDTSKRHDQVVEAITSVPIEGFIVVRSRRLDNSEHSRRKCMEDMMPELEALGCAHLTLESRGKADDRRDLDMLGHLRRRRLNGHSVKMDHTPGPKDPMLWIADALCGAVVEDRCGEPKYLDRLASRVTIRVIDS